MKLTKMVFVTATVVEMEEHASKVQDQIQAVTAHQTTPEIRVTKLSALLTTATMEEHVLYRGPASYVLVQKDSPLPDVKQI